MESPRSAHRRRHRACAVELSAPLHHLLHPSVYSAGRPWWPRSWRNPGWLPDRPRLSRPERPGRRWSPTTPPEADPGFTTRPGDPWCRRVGVAPSASVACRAAPDVMTTFRDTNPRPQFPSTGHYGTRSRRRADESLIRKVTSDHSSNVCRREVARRVTPDTSCRGGSTQRGSRCDLHH
jgi:hypothetical protein